MLRLNRLPARATLTKRSIAFSNSHTSAGNVTHSHSQK